MRKDLRQMFMQQARIAEQQAKEAKTRGEVSPVANKISKVGVIRAMPVDEWMDEAAKRPDPVMLWREFIYQGEVTCLFADSNVGKSVLAVQIARDIAAKGMRVVYLDCEMTAKQVERRYTDEQTGIRCSFPKNLIRGEIEINEDTKLNMEEEILPSLRDYALSTQCQVMIIDNLTWLTSTAEHGEAASLLMKELIRIKKEHDITILVLAHTPKRQPGTKISQNDLAGSKQLMNFFDAAFAIGKSSRDENMRYVKQVKCRSNSMVYNSENVLVCELIKTDGFLHFEEVGTGSEHEHITEPQGKEKAQQVRDIVALANAGKSQRQIAEELGLSKTTVQRTLRNHWGQSA